jgi:hypothetical protein
VTTWGDRVPSRDLEQDAERYRLLTEAFVPGLHNQA